MTNKKKLLERTMNRLLFTEKEWDEMFQDFKNSETKAIVCAKWKLKNSEYKLLRDYIYGRL